MFLRCASGSNFCFHFSTHVQCRLCCILHNFHLLHSFTLHIPVVFVVNTGHEGKQTEFLMRFLQRSNKNFAAFVENGQSRVTLMWTRFFAQVKSKCKCFLEYQRDLFLSSIGVQNEANSAVLENSTSQKSKRTHFPLIKQPAKVPKQTRLKVWNVLGPSLQCWYKNKRSRKYSPKQVLVTRCVQPCLYYSLNRVSLALIVSVHTIRQCLRDLPRKICMLRKESGFLFHILCASHALLRLCPQFRPRSQGLSSSLHLKGGEMRGRGTRLPQHFYIGFD